MSDAKSVRRVSVVKGLFYEEWNVMLITENDHHLIGALEYDKAKEVGESLASFFCCPIMEREFKFVKEE